MPPADAGNVSSVRSIILIRLGKITLNMTIFHVVFLLQRTQTALSVSALNTQSSGVSAFSNRRVTYRHAELHTPRPLGCFGERERIWATTCTTG